MTKVIGITACSSADCVGLAAILESILEGARSLGCSSEHHLVTDSPGIGVGAAQHFTGIAVNEDAVQALARHAADFDHVILASSGTPRDAASPTGLFVKACYTSARWLSLATLPEGSEADLGLASGGAEFRFTVPSRPITPAHKGLVIIGPSEVGGDHDGPFSEESFFVLEEVERLLGFMPSGRILATGLFCPPLEDNPILRRQTLELGSSLLSGGLESARK